MDWCAVSGDGLTLKAQKTVSMVRFVTKEKTGKKLAVAARESTGCVLCHELGSFMINTAE